MRPTYRDPDPPTTPDSKIAERVEEWMRDDLRVFDPACPHCTKLRDSLVNLVKDEVRRSQR